MVTEQRSSNLEVPSSNHPGTRAFFLFFYQRQSILNGVTGSMQPKLCLVCLGLEVGAGLDYTEGLKICSGC